MLNVVCFFLQSLGCIEPGLNLFIRFESINCSFEFLSDIRVGTSLYARKLCTFSQESSFWFKECPISNRFQTRRQNVSRFGNDYWPRYFAPTCQVLTGLLTSIVLDRSGNLMHQHCVWVVILFRDPHLFGLECGRLRSFRSHKQSGFQSKILIVNRTWRWRVRDLP